MLRLTAIVSILCLALLGVQATKLCGRNRQCQCVPHHLCNIGFKDEGPVLDFEKKEGCASTEACCPPNKILQENEDNSWMNPPKKTECGQVNSKGLTFSIQSADGFAQENELPWMTAVLHMNNSYLGGGSLVAFDVVLTANHITSDFDSGDLVVRAGEWDFGADTEKFSHVDVGVRMIVRHPSFDRRTGANNLALLFLEKPLEASRHIGLICLPARNQNFDRQWCIVSGWGKDAIEQNSYMSIMKKVKIPIVDSRTCEALLKPLRRTNFQLHDSLLCAGGELGKDSCKGDGGSPLACPLRSDPSRFEQAGIVNWGMGCGRANTPAVYTDVAKLRTWVDEQIKAHSNANVEFNDDDEDDDAGEYDSSNDSSTQTRFWPATPQQNPPKVDMKTIRSAN